MCADESHYSGIRGDRRGDPGQWTARWEHLHAELIHLLFIENLVLFLPRCAIKVENGTLEDNF